MAFFSALNGVTENIQNMNIGSKNSAFEQRGFNHRMNSDFDVYDRRNNDQRKPPRNEAEQDLESLIGFSNNRQNTFADQSAHSNRNRQQPFVEGSRYQPIQPQADDGFIPSRITDRETPLYQTTNVAGGGGGRVDERTRKPPKKERFVPREKQQFELYDEDEQIRPGTHFKKLMNDDVFVTGVSEEEGAIYVEFFAQCGFSPQIMKNLQLKKYRDPTPIQKYVIPLILQKKGDILGRAQTGSGKTAAFLLPIIQKIQRYKAQGHPVVRGSPFALIIGVTGELTLQLYEDARAFSNQTGVSVQYNIGGVNVRNVLNGLKYSDCDIMVTTIGRAKHFIDDQELKLDQIRYLVLDEADRLLNNVDFMADLNSMLKSGTYTNYRTFLFSATFDNDIQRVAYENYLIGDKTYFVSVGNENRVVDTVQQEFIMVEQHAKQDLLIEMLKARSRIEPLSGNKYYLYPENTIVFVAKKRHSDRVALALAQAGFNAISINADRTCRQRVEAIEKFSKNLYQILVATDVASRGMNFPRIKYVVNYDLPNVEDTTYIHRVGRAGRAGNEGYATSFFDPYSVEDLKHANFYMKTLLSVKQKVPLFLADIVEKDKQSCEHMRRLHGLAYDEPDSTWN